MIGAIVRVIRGLPCSPKADELSRITLLRTRVNRDFKRAEDRSPALLNTLILCLRLGNRFPVGLVLLLLGVGVGVGQDEVAICAVGVHPRQVEAEAAAEGVRLYEQDLLPVSQNPSESCFMYALRPVCPGNSAMAGRGAARTQAPRPQQPQPS